MKNDKDKKEYQIVISTRIPEILNRQMRALCDRKGIKITAFITAAIKKHLKEV
jgi:acetolactate synthase regulatory subunit